MQEENRKRKSPARTTRNSKRTAVPSPAEELAHVDDFVNMLSDELDAPREATAGDTEKNRPATSLSVPPGLTVGSAVAIVVTNALDQPQPPQTPVGNPELRDSPPTPLLAVGQTSVHAPALTTVHPAVAATQATPRATVNPEANAGPLDLTDTPPTSPEPLTPCARFVTPSRAPRKTDKTGSRRFPMIVESEDDVSEAEEDPDQGLECLVISGVSKDDFKVVLENIRSLKVQASAANTVYEEGLRKVFLQFPDGLAKRYVASLRNTWPSDRYPLSVGPIERAKRSFLASIRTPVDSPIIVSAEELAEAAAIFCIPVIPSELSLELMSPGLYKLGASRDTIRRLRTQRTLCIQGQEVVFAKWRAALGHKTYTVFISGIDDRASRNGILSYVAKEVGDYISATFGTREDGTPSNWMTIAFETKEERNCAISLTGSKNFCGQPLLVDKSKTLEQRAREAEQRQREQANRAASGDRAKLLPERNAAQRETRASKNAGFLEKARARADQLAQQWKNA